MYNIALDKLCKKYDKQIAELKEKYDTLSIKWDGRGMEINRLEIANQKLKAENERLKIALNISRQAHKESQDTFAKAQQTFWKQRDALILGNTKSSARNGKGKNEKCN